MLRQLTVAILAIALLGALVPPLAPAKGSIEASLNGPGLEVPLPFAWTHGGVADDPRRGPFEHVALATGFPVVFAHASMETFDAASRRLRLERRAGTSGRSTR